MPFITSTAGSGTGQYFADENSNPVMIRADTAWALSYNAGNSGGASTWQDDIDSYCAIRAGQGFNSFLIATVGYTGIGAVNDDGRSWDGIQPFTSPGVLNDPYWARVDYLLQSAENNGLTVFLNVMFRYSLSTAGGALNGWSTGQYTTYGTALGTRYGAFPNVVWEFGDDYADEYNTAFSAVLAAIRATGDTHLISVENLTPSTSRFSVADNSVFTWGTANAQFNWCYGYGPAYNSVEYAYREASPLPVCKMDGKYDIGGNSDSRFFWRSWAWWSLSCGSRGFMYGRDDVYPWPSGALSLLANNNPDNADFAIYWNAFASLAGWHKLVPDTASALVTAGRGTRRADSDDSQYSSGNTYVTASRTADGTLAVIYLPNAASAITVNGGAMVAGYGAKWMDPCTGATSAATIASTYSHAGANSLGGADWLLILAVPPYATWSVP